MSSERLTSGSCVRRPDTGLPVRVRLGQLKGPGPNWQLPRRFGLGGCGDAMF
jgi:hypothetical protein